MQYVQKMLIEILENMRRLESAPGVCLKELPPEHLVSLYELDGGNEDVGGGTLDRLGRYAREHVIIRDEEGEEVTNQMPQWY